MSVCVWCIGVFLCMYVGVCLSGHMSECVVGEEPLP